MEIILLDSVDAVLAALSDKEIAKTIRTSVFVARFYKENPKDTC